VHARVVYASPAFRRRPTTREWYGRTAARGPPGNCSPIVVASVTRRGAEMNWLSRQLDHLANSARPIERLATRGDCRRRTLQTTTSNSPSEQQFHAVSRPVRTSNSYSIHALPCLVHSFIDIAHVVCGEGSMKRSSVRLSVYPIVRPTAAAACSGFAAERRAGMIYR